MAVTKNPMQSKFVIPNAKDETVIIWNHGTDNSFLQNNCQDWWSLPPESIMDFQNENTSVFYLCSQVTDFFDFATYTIRRGYEIEAVLDKLIETGVKPKNIWVAGQSAGAWSTLLMSAKAKKKFNGAILFAPASGGKKKRILENPNYAYSKMHYRQLKQFEKLPQKAIIFTFADDQWNTKKDFENLKKAHSNTITLREYNCGQGHSSNRQNCQKQKIKAEIKSFMNKK